MSSLDNSPNNIYILGTAEYGISNTPILIQDEYQLQTYFGTRGTVIEAYRKLLNITDKPNIYLCKCNGTHASSKINILSNNKIIRDAVEFKSVYSSELFNGTTILLNDKYLQIKLGESIIQYDFSKYNTVHKLFKAINDDAENKISPVMVCNYTLEEYEHPAKAICSCNQKVTTLNGGESGLLDNKNQIYHSIKNNLNLLHGEKIDVLLFADCYIDDNYYDHSESMSKVYDIDNKLIHNLKDQKEIINISNITYTNKNNKAEEEKNYNKLLNPVVEKDNFINLSFYELMLNFCIKQSKYNCITKGVIGFKPLKDIFDVQYYLKYYKHINKKIKFSNIPQKFYSLVTVTCMDVYYDYGNQIDNHYIAYAGVISSENYNVNITNINYGENIFYRQYLNNIDVHELKDTDFVLLRLSPLTHKVHIVNANTLTNGLLGCEYTIRTIQLLSKLVVKHFDKHIGENLSIENERKFHETIKQCFNELINSSCAINYKYNINTTTDGTSIINCNLFFPGFLDPLTFIMPIK